MTKELNQTLMILVMVSCILLLFSCNKIVIEDCPMNIEETFESNPKMEELKAKIRRVALQGDSLCGVKEIKLLNDSDQQKILQDEYMKTFFNRFNNAVFVPEVNPDVKNQFVIDLIGIYQEYWWKALLKKEKLEILEKELQMRVREHFSIAEMASAEEFRKIYEATLQANGIYAISGKTLPLFEFLAWTKEEENNFEVELLRTIEYVKVVFISDFVSEGWGFYATGDQSGTGGWAAKNKLYCLKDCYKDLRSETFVISYLKHEAQHYRDYREFPWIEGIDLEYRAKLTEIAFSHNQMKEILKYFAASEPKNLSSPHCIANKVLINNMLKKLHLGQDVKKIFEVDIKTLDETARLLFDEHTILLQAQESKDTKMQPVAEHFKKELNLLNN